MPPKRPGPGPYPPDQEACANGHILVEPITARMRLSPRNGRTRWRVCKVCESWRTRLRHARRDLRNAEAGLQPHEKELRHKVEELEGYIRRRATYRSSMPTMFWAIAYHETINFLENSNHDPDVVWRMTK